jgi:hypothetical protein
MKTMYRIAILALLSIAAFAQKDVPPGEKPPAEPAEKPPAEVDQALRARVNEFYSLMVSQQFRKAEALIAEDTKDYYYAGTKPEIHKYEIVGIEYTDRFTHAKVMTRCNEPIAMAGFPPGEITVIVPTLWKIENGNWALYEDPNKITNPSGLRSKIQSAVDGSAGQAALPAMPKELPKDPSFALGKLQIDKPVVKLEAGTVETITISNTSAGPVTLEPGYPLPEIEPKLDRTELGKGEKAILTLTAGKQPGTGFYYLRVMPTGEVLRIEVKAK